MNSAKLVISDCKITGNTAGTNGGGISSSGSGTALEISGCEIMQNSAKTAGGGIYFGSTVVSLTDVTIKNNILVSSSTSNGAGLCNNSRGPLITISGKIVIKDNYAGTDAKIENSTASGTTENNYTMLNVTSGSEITTVQKITVAGALTTGSEFHMTCTLTTVLTSGYAENNTDENGIVIDPAEYFKLDSNSNSYAVVLNSDGEAQLAASAPEWSVTYGDSGEGSVPTASAYGVTFTYSVNTITAITLTGITVTVKAEGGEEEIDLSSNPIQNAGTYLATAAITGVGSGNTVTVQFTVIVTPYDISASESGVTYSLSVSGWTGGEDVYSAYYDGSAKTKPEVTVTFSLKSQTLTGDDYTVVYYLGGSSESDGTPVTELKEVGTYKVVITGTGNFTGDITCSERFEIAVNTALSYTVVWQYYDGESWVEIGSAEAEHFTYTGISYTDLVRIKLTTDGETRYVYSNGTEEYNLAEGESEGEISKWLYFAITSDGEEADILNAGQYALALVGSPNYSVEDSDRSSSVSVARYDLSAIDEDSTDSADISASLDSTSYNGQEKTLTLAVTLTLGGNEVALGEEEYTYTVMYVQDDAETECGSILLGGVYRIYITAAGDNLSGTLGIYAQLNVVAAENTVTCVVQTGDWAYGTFQWDVNDFEFSAKYLYDGTVEGTEAQYIYYTVTNSDGETVNETLTGFTEVTDTVKAALNALEAGSYIMYARVQATTSYTEKENSFTFTVVQATNRWLRAPSVVEWEWNAYVAGVHLIATAEYGSDSLIKTVLNGDGTAVEGLESFTEVTESIAALLLSLAAGAYKLTVTVAETVNYTGLTETLDFNVLKAANYWNEVPDIKSWAAGYYDGTANAVSGSAKYGEIVYTVYDADGNAVTDLASAGVGTYTLTATVEGTSDYEGLTYSTTFTVFENADLSVGTIAGTAVIGALIVVMLVASAFAAVTLFRRSRRSGR